MRIRWPIETFEGVGGDANSAAGCSVPNIAVTLSIAVASAATRHSLNDEELAKYLYTT